jgi:hypothetical protein
MTMPTTSHLPPSTPSSDLPTHAEHTANGLPTMCLPTPQYPPELEGGASGAPHPKSGEAKCTECGESRSLMTFLRSSRTVNAAWASAWTASEAARSSTARTGTGNGRRLLRRRPAAQSHREPRKDAL